MRKNIIKAVFFVAISTFFVTLNSCDTGYNTVPFGFNLIYMPQATSTGGLTKNYTVPNSVVAGLDTSVYNFRSDTINHKLYVRLGVSASGKYADAGYTVNIGVDNDTTNQIVTWGNAQYPSLNYMAIPSSMYTTLPTSITVPAGKYAATFELELDATALKSYATPLPLPTPAPVGKKLLLTVAISNATNYTINTTFNKTVVLIDLDALNKVTIYK